MNSNTDNIICEPHIILTRLTRNDQLFYNLQLNYPGGFVLRRDSLSPLRATLTLAALVNELVIITRNIKRAIDLVTCDIQPTPPKPSEE